MFQAGAICYETASAANAAVGSAQSGGVVPVSGQPHIIVFQSATSSSITYGYVPVDGGPTVTQTVAIVPPGCLLLTGSDAFDMGWMLAAVWVSVYAITFLVRAVRDFLGPQNDS